ncbi:MAG: serine protein kinase RIO [Methanotrichaceae archaeon]|nr:serine protein kinase RIO [Methanotrichaceae archaeon]
MSRRSKVEELDTRIDALRAKIKDSEDLKVQEAVFDNHTLMDLYSLASRGIIDALGGSISTGKEANIFRALSAGRPVALKIYRISTSNFKAMQDYLHGDPRFGSIKGSKRSIVSAWTKKEFRNLKRAEEVGIRVPHPIAMRDNILVMELVTIDDDPAPPLKEVRLNREDAERVYEKLCQYISLLYNQAGLVHADLSEFNILYDGEPIIIDMGQSVTLDHPMAQKFLGRDIDNVVRYFQKNYGIGSRDEIISAIKSDAKAKGPAR